MIFKLEVFILLLGCLRSVVGSMIPARDYDNKSYFIVELDVSQSNKPLQDFITEYLSVYSFEHQVRGFDDHFVFSLPKNHSHNEFIGNYNSNQYRLLKRESFESEYDSLVHNKHLRSIHLLEPKQLTKRLPVSYLQQEHTEKRSFVAVDSSQLPIQQASEKLGINDPIFSQQWHLINANYPGNDVNATGLWYEGITGEGVVTCLIDDGLDYEDADIKENFNAKGSWDFNDNTALPKPRLSSDYHGTRCAGEIAAVKNDKCGVGVAYNSQVSGVRILSGAITSEDEAAAMIFGLDVNDIYSCSWGPTDDGKTVAEPEIIVKKAMIKGVQDGRNKKGAIYVFASGNGGGHDDSCNFDGYTNSIYSITVGAIDHKGMHPYYSEACSAVMVVTYSSGSGEHIHTTDIHDQCSASHGGTSAAAPLAAGIFALVLQVNPELTWRDLQYVAALSSVPVNEDDGHYQTTALGRKYSHKYGYGKIDAYEMAKFAKTWKNVKPQSWLYSDVVKVGDSIQFDAGNTSGKSKIISSTLVINQRELEIMNVETIEHVAVTVNIKSNFRGQVGIRLTSPFGVVSDLATFRGRDLSGEGFNDWTFLSVAHWGEKAIGEWKLEIVNNPDSNGNKIELVDWQLKLFGESKDADKVEIFDIDKDYAKVRRDRLAELEKEPTTTAEASTKASTKASSMVPETTTVSTVSENTEANKAVTSSKVAGPTESDSDSDSDNEKEHEDHEDHEGHEDHEDHEDQGDEDGKKASYGDIKGFYFMGLVAVGFGVIILIMKYHKTPSSTRRRRRREEYEFDIIPGEDYSDSDSHDSLDLGHRNDEGYNLDDERDRLFDEINGNSLPDYQEGEMFKIGDEEEDNSEQKPKGKTTKVDKQVNFKDSVESFGPAIVTDNSDNPVDLENQPTKSSISQDSSAN